MSIKNMVQGLEIITKYGSVYFVGQRLVLIEILKAAQRSLHFRNHQFIKSGACPRGSVNADTITVQSWPFNLPAPFPTWPTT